MVVNHSAIFEAYTGLRPFEVPCHLCSVGSSRGTPSCHFSFCLRHVSHFVGETALDYPWNPCIPLDPVPFVLRDCSQLEEASSRASLLMTSLQLVPDPLSKKNSIACLLLTGWQAVLITTLPWIVPVRPCASEARTCKTERVTPF
jgi:hypothetical protein